jgi:hypothetical protein
MRRRFAAALSGAVVCGAVIGLIAPSSFAVEKQKAAQARTDSDHQIYSTIKDLMDSIVGPSADVIWGAGGTIADNQGVQDQAPKAEEEWHNVRRAAIRLIEGSNLLIMPSREAASAGVKSKAPGVELEPAEVAALIKKKRKNFDAAAKALQGLGVELLRASEAKNADSLNEIGGRMEEVCESCHKAFWYPGDQPPARSN